MAKKKKTTTQKKYRQVNKVYKKSARSLDTSRLALVLLAIIVLALGVSIAAFSRTAVENISIVNFEDLGIRPTSTPTPQPTLYIEKTVSENRGSLAE